MQFATFRIGQAYCGIHLPLIREIIPLPQITPVDTAPPIVRGLINLRGQVVTLLSLEERFGLSGSEPGEDCRCIVLKTNEELHGLDEESNVSDSTCDDPLGFLVDEMQNIVEARKDEIQPPAANMQLESRFVSGLLPQEDRLLSILKLGALLASEDLMKAARD